MNSKPFSINADTCTLKYNNQSNGNSLFRENLKYVVPIYQRPYSWEYEQIRKFLSDIVLSFWGNDGESEPEAMFIGTMQLSERKYINKYITGRAYHQQEIIDGQQRLTTLLILLKILKDRFSDCMELQTIEFNWLQTKVNNGKQQFYLNEFINNSEYFEETLNPYLKNSYIIKEILDEIILSEENDLKIFSINKFVKHILSNVYFVIIETCASLSKTLQIFNAINTTGLDLNTGDIFKINIYDYLVGKKNCGEEVFNEISKLYEKIDEKNRKAGYAITNIIDILSIYQYILIAEYELPNVLYSYATDTFFERLFDSIFNINIWEHYKHLKNLDLNLDDIDRIIEMRYEWETMGLGTAEDNCAINFIWWSRYSRYWILVFILMFRFKDYKDHIQEIYKFIRQLSKLFIIYSVLYLKAVGEIHSFVYSLIEALLNKPYEKIIELIDIKINGSSKYRGENKVEFENDINGDIVYNTKIKNIVCRLSAMLSEDYQTTEKTELLEIEKKLFEFPPIDMEHIQSYNDIDEEERQKIWEEWGSDINSIGNLVVLELSINRSIQNKPYIKKITEEPGYKDSCYKAIKRLIDEYSEWNLTNCKKRKLKEVNRIVDYLFN